jgi:hypothetical protein
MDASYRSPILIESVRRALRLVDAVGALDGRGQAKELARAVGLVARRVLAPGARLNTANAAEVQHLNEVVAI